MEHTETTETTRIKVECDTNSRKKEDIRQGCVMCMNNECSGSE